MAAPREVPQETNVSAFSQSLTGVTLIPWSSIKLGALLGQGGYGIVHNAAWRQSESMQPLEVAVKLLPLEASASAKRAFLREIRCIASLRHPCLVQIHGVCLDVRGQTGELALVMEKCSRSILEALTQSEEHTEDDRLTLPQKHQIAMDMASALEFLHSRVPAVIHGDVKPHNVLLSESETFAPDDQDRRHKRIRARLSDFGLSLVAHTSNVSYARQSSSVAGGMHGTLMYLAPEAVSEEEEAQQTTKQDVYAWASSCVELYSGEKPWPGLTQVQIFKRLIAGTVPNIPESVPRELYALLRDCLQSDPGARPAAAQVFQRLVDLDLPLPDEENSTEDDEPPECCICGELCTVKGNLVCGSDKQHVVCATCAVKLMQHALEPSRLRKNDGRIQCPVDKCSYHFLASDLDALSAREAVTAYVTGLQRFVATLVRQPMPSTAARVQPDRAAKHDDASTQQKQLEADVQRHCQHIVEELLTLRCPACRAVFADYDGCDALTCSRCGVAFCALCLENCGQDAHRHVSQTHGNIYGGLKNFEATHRARRKDLVLAFLRTLQPQVGAAVLQGCFRHLQDLGLRLAEFAEVVDPKQAATELARTEQQLERLQEQFQAMQVRSASMVQASENERKRVEAENHRLQRQLIAQQQQQQQQQQQLQQQSQRTSTSSNSNGEYFNHYWRTSDPNSAAGRTIHTGPRGGKFYYNAAGNKVYV